MDKQRRGRPPGQPNHNAGPKPGRPKGSPQMGGNHGKDRHLMLSVRVSEKELAMINEAATRLGVSKADLIVMAIQSLQFERHGTI